VDIVIAANMNGDIFAKHFEKTEANKKEDNSVGDKITYLVMEYSALYFQWLIIASNRQVYLTPSQAPSISRKTG
jgi:hypothetical protein